MASTASPIVISPEQLEEERKTILNQYMALLRAGKPFMRKGDRKLIRAAFEMAVEAHKEMRRKSGEPYIYHPIAVAQIVAEEIGLGTTSIICALLHDTVEDTDITLQDVEREFGKTVAKIIDGLTKLSGLHNKSSSQQAENFRKMLLTLTDDVRVILVKLADRLHNMRTLDSMAKEKQLKIASETQYLYAPLAHRLGLYAIKSELEDLAMKYLEPDLYKMIARKLRETKAKRDKFIRDFITPLKKELESQGFQFEIKGRPKSIFSIGNKIKKQNISFEEVYDLFAIRVILDSEGEQEKQDCWRVYSIVTDYYPPNPNRLRDWISTPKANGYESLHTTVMSPSGKWVEVQIRTRRMDELAEKGLAAHWKYKTNTADSGLDEWLEKIREALENPEPNALEFIDDFKLQLYAKEIFIFTPKGDLIKLPGGSTALDFAFEIHSDLGAKCIGAKVNHKIVPLSYELQNGDQVEIITSNIQKPNPDWLKFVITAKAKSKIKQLLKENRRKEAEHGKEIFERKMRNARLEINGDVINKLLKHFRLQYAHDLYYMIAIEKIDWVTIKQVLSEDGIPEKRENRINESNFESVVKSRSGKNDEWLVIDDKIDRIDYSLANCCTPIPGDDIFGFITVSEGIKIHRVNCPNAVDLLSKYGYRVVKAKWTGQQEVSFLAGIRIEGIDDIGIISGISQVISNDLKVNMRSISVISNDGMFEGKLMVYVHDTRHLESLMKKLLTVKGVLKVSRLDT